MKDEGDEGEEETLGSGWPASNWKSLWGWQEVELKLTDGN